MNPCPQQPWGHGHAHRLQAHWQYCHNIWDEKKLISQQSRWPKLEIFLQARSRWRELYLLSSKRITEIILRVAVIPGLRIIRAFSENYQVIRIGYGKTSGMNKSDYTNKLAIIRGFGIVNKGCKLGIFWKFRTWVFRLYCNIKIKLMERERESVSG